MAKKRQPGAKRAQAGSWPLRMSLPTGEADQDLRTHSPNAQIALEVLNAIAGVQMPLNFTQMCIRPVQYPPGGLPLQVARSSILCVIRRFSTISGNCYRASGRR